MMVYEARKSEDTCELGRKMGQEAVPGRTVCLNGGLEVGKTVFIQDFTQGLGIDEPVNSPTLTIVQQYGKGRLPLYHFDVYHIEGVNEMDEIGYGDCFFGEGVCLIEWSDLVRDILPDRVIQVTTEKDLERGSDHKHTLVEENR